MTKTTKTKNFTGVFTKDEATQEKLITQLLTKEGYTHLECDCIEKDDNEVVLTYDGYSDAQVRIEVTVKKQEERIIIKDVYITDKYFTQHSDGYYYIKHNELVLIDLKPKCPQCGNPLRYFEITKSIKEYSLMNNRASLIFTEELDEDPIELGIFCTDGPVPCGFSFSKKSCSANISDELKGALQASINKISKLI